MAVPDRPRIQGLIAGGILGAFTITVLWPLCVGRTLYWGDIALYFEPMTAFTRARLTSGHIPLWNPHILGGQPLLGNPQMGVFYPGTALLLFLPTWLYLSVSSLVHLFLCGFLMFRYLQRWTLRWPSALCGALVYMGSGCLVGRLQFPTMIQTSAYFPLVLSTVDACIDKPGLPAHLALVVVVAVAVLAAHAQMAYLVLVWSATYAVVRLWRRRNHMAHGPERRRALVTGLIPLLVCGVLGLTLASAQVLPAMQLLAESSRERLTPCRRTESHWTLPNS